MCELQFNHKTLPTEHFKILDVSVRQLIQVAIVEWWHGDKPSW